MWNKLSSHFLWDVVTGGIMLYLQFWWGWWEWGIKDDFDDWWYNKYHVWCLMRMRKLVEPLWCVSEGITRVTPFLPGINNLPSTTTHPLTHLCPTMIPKGNQSVFFFSSWSEINLSAGQMFVAMAFFWSDLIPMFLDTRYHHYWCDEIRTSSLIH